MKLISRFEFFESDDFYSRFDYLRMEPAKRVYAGVFIVSLAALVLEISLTRIFAVAQWFHFAFMVISMAFFGFAASGTLFAVWPGLLKRGTERLLMLFSLLFSVSAIGSFLLTNPVPFDPYQLMWDPGQLLRLVYYYALWSLPFLFAGGVVAIAMTKLSEEVNVVYFANVAGSGLGAGLAVLLLPLLPGSGILSFVALLGAASALLFARGPKLRGGLAAWALLLIPLLVLPPAVNISPYKGLNQALNFQGARIIDTGWDAQSRVDVIESPGVRVAPGLSLDYRGGVPDQLGLTIDGGSLSAVPMGSGEFLAHTPLDLPHELRAGKTLVVDAKGGLEVLAALRRGSEVEVVEPNALAAGMVEEHSSMYEGVDVRVSGVRDLPDERYDLIVLPVSGDAASASLGIYGMSEDYMFTVEGFKEYMEHLEPGGFLAVTRWLQNPPRELPRIVAIAAQAVEDPGRQIAAIRTYVTSTVLVKNGELEAGEVEAVKGFASRLGYDLVYCPGISDSEVNLRSEFPEPLYHKSVLAALSGDYSYLFDITPPTDDKPYFSNFFRWDRTGELYESMGRKWEPFFEGGFVIFFVLVQAIVLSLLFIFLPVARSRKLGKRLPGKWLLLSYFFLIGLAFMMFEMAAIQKLTLWLGQNIYSFSLVVTSMLLFVGAGSYASRRMGLGRLKWVMLAIALLFPSYPLLFSLDPGGGILLRALLAFFLLAPVGFLLGIPFPTGMRVAGRIDNSLIPWSWASNGCASVLGSVVGALVAISMGLTVVFLLAGLAYLAALAMMVLLRPPCRP